jgi:hypothetical protein
MAVVFPDDFNPEFAGVDPDVASYWLRKAECAIDCQKFLAAGLSAECCDEAIELKASHLMKEAGLGTGPAVPAGSITSEARGGKSITRATGGGATGKHGSTVYGQALDNILARVFAPGKRRRLPPRPAPACCS